jgi:hypothetical protein
MARHHSLFEDEVGHTVFQIPVDHCERRQIERGVSNHQHPDPAGDSVGLRLNEIDRARFS